MSKNHVKEENQGKILYLSKEINIFFYRLKEENEHLLRQLNDRTQQYENEKSTLLLDHQRRLDDLQRDRTSELENLRTLQRFKSFFFFSKTSFSNLSLDKLLIIYDVNMNKQFNV
jgi:hypothetical protein